MEYLGITTDPNRDSLFDQSGVKRLKESYMKDTETSPQERFAFVSKHVYLHIFALCACASL